MYHADSCIYSDSYAYVHMSVCVHMLDMLLHFQYVLNTCFFSSILRHVLTPGVIVHSNPVQGILHAMASPWASKSVFIQ